MLTFRPISFLKFVTTISRYLSLPQNSTTMQSIEETIGYHFTNNSLKDEALLAAGASIASPSVDGDPRGNKRLALVGDAVLQLVVLQRWYKSGADTGRQDFVPATYRLADTLRSVWKQIAQTVSFKHCVEHTCFLFSPARCHCQKPLPKGKGSKGDIGIHRRSVDWGCLA